MILRTLLSLYSKNGNMIYIGGNNTRAENYYTLHIIKE